MVKPLPHGYAHRDCEFRPPLYRSLSAGFSSIEADCYCLFGRVLVAHDPQQLRFARTLEKFYLAPLRRMTRNGGKVFADSTPLWLFLDIKTGARASYAAIDRLLSRYPDMLSTFTPGHASVNAVTVILSGNRLPYGEVARLAVRYTALDGRVPDLGVHTDPCVMPVVSDDWRKYFTWLGRGPMPADERAALASMVRTAHRYGQKLRFWNTPDDDTPDRTAVWDTLLAAGVDLVNTDDIEGFRRYVQGRR